MNGIEKMKKKVRSMKYVIVATRSRPWSILAGELVKHSPEHGSVTLANVRMIAYFSSDSRTVVGVAERGVTSDARVSPRIDQGTFYGVEMILDATPKARASIEEEPWS